MGRGRALDGWRRHAARPPPPPPPLVGARIPAPMLPCPTLHRHAAGRGLCGGRAGAPAAEPRRAAPPRLGRRCGCAGVRKRHANALLRLLPCLHTLAHAAAAALPEPRPCAGPHRMAARALSVPIPGTPPRITDALRGARQLVPLGCCLHAAAAPRAGLHQSMSAGRHVAAPSFQPCTAPSTPPPGSSPCRAPALGRGARRGRLPGGRRHAAAAGRPR